MAASQKKSSSGNSKTGSGSRSGSSTSRSGGRKSAQPQKKPVRREVWGVVLCIFALCLVISYFGGKAVVIDWIAVLVKGLFGYGYYLMAPAMLGSALILFCHHGRPVRLRVTCAMLLPLFAGALGHLAWCRETMITTVRLFPTLWETGLACESGGVLSGLLAIGGETGFTKVGAAIILAVVTSALLMVALRLTLGALIEKNRSRPQYEEEPEEFRSAKRAGKEGVRLTPIEPQPRRRTEGKVQIDFPLDDEPAAPAKTKAAPAIPAEERPLPEKRKGLLGGFFRPKSESQKTPDQLLTEGSHPAPAAAKPEVPAAQPVPASVPAQVPAAQPAIPAEPASRKEKQSAAAEVQNAAAAVTQEIEERKVTEDVYQFPPITLLNQNPGGNVAEAGAELRNNSRRLAETLASFGVDATAGDVVHGPSVTRYEFVLDQGVKLSKVTNLADDIALALGATGVRIAPIPEKISVVGIEVPNKQVTGVLIRDVLETREFTENPSKVAFALGKDISGKCIIGNIAKLPHVLIAGTTGSGKSVCTNSLIVSLLYKSSPEDVRFIMVDPKMVELAPYNGIPHLLIPVVTDPKKAAGALQWAVFEMMKRYKIFSEHNVKDLSGYNALAKTTDELEHLPSVVVVIDELADLMLVAAKEVEESICRVAQMGRAAGVHLVIATQRPSADVITGLMKANIPSRIAFAVASSLESRIILDNSGAEKLIGKGDMLYAPLGIGKPIRVQGCFISPEEIERVVEYVKSTGEADYSDEVMRKIEESVQEKDKGGKGAAPAPQEEETGESDELFPAAVDVVLELGQASVSMLQRRLKLGYSRAARLVDQMEEKGIVGPFEGSKPRALLITKQQWQEMRMGGAAADPAGEPSFPLEEDGE